MSHTLANLTAMTLRSKMGHTTRKKATLACINCRNRRIKCDSTSLSQPCSNCTKLHIKCVRISTDRRKGRHSTQYIHKIETQLSRYKDVIKVLQENVHNSNKLLESLQGGEVIEQTNLPITPPKNESNDDTGDGLLPTLENAQFLKKDKLNQSTKVTVYGPISVYDNELIPTRSGSHGNDSSSLNTNPLIIQCVKLFFQWQYPDMHFFIFREAFLLDFFNSNTDYCSKELVYSICAIGAILSDDPSVREDGPRFYNRAKDSLMMKLDVPSLPSVQAYLLLGLYDIYNGRNNSGWMLTGMGLRMGFDIGFELNPKVLLLRSNEKVREFTINVQSRIFWGCFITDRFVGLILGRPTILKETDTTIPQSENMPRIQWLGDYTYPGIGASTRASYIDISNALKVMLKLIKISDQMLHELFSPGSIRVVPDVEVKLRLLKKYNRKIIQWRKDIPSKLQWDRSELMKKGFDPTNMYWRYFYYMVLLCLNRPFIEVAKGNSTVESTNSLEICSNVMADLHVSMFSFIKYHGFGKCSILIIYCCIIALSIILLSISGGKFKESELFNRYFFDFMIILKFSPWKLGDQSYNRIKKSLICDQKFDYDEEFHRYQKMMRDEGTESIAMFIYNDSGTDASDSGPDQVYNDEHPLAYAGFGGPPVFMNSEMMNVWETLFPDYITPALDP